MTQRLGMMQASDIKQGSGGASRPQAQQGAQRVSMGLGIYDDDELWRRMMMMRIGRGRAGMSPSLIGARGGGFGRPVTAGVPATVAAPTDNPGPVIPKPRPSTPYVDPHPGGYFDVEGGWHPEDPPAPLPDGGFPVPVAPEAEATGQPGGVSPEEGGMDSGMDPEQPII